KMVLLLDSLELKQPFYFVGRRLLCLRQDRLRAPAPRKPSGHARQKQQRGLFPGDTPATAPTAAPGPARKVREEDQGRSVAEGGGSTSGGAQSRLWRAGR